MVRLMVVARLFDPRLLANQLEKLYAQLIYTCLYSLTSSTLIL